MRSDKRRVVPIGELCLGVFDGPHATPRKTEEGPIFLGISNIENGRTYLADAAHLSEEDFERWTRRVIPQEDDVVFSYETRLGQAALIPRGLRCCLGRRLALMRPDTSKVVPRYLLYAYLGPGFQHTIRNRTFQGSTVDRIPLTEFPSFPISVPPLPEQRRIVGVLGALDDKVDHNYRVSVRLAELAQSLFRTAVAQWRGYSQPARLSDIVAPSREPADARLPYIGLDAMPRGSTVLSEWAIEDAPSGQAVRFRRGDVLFGKLRPYFKKVGVAPVDGRCSTEILVLRPKESHLWGLLLGCVSSDAFIAYCVQVSRGTKMPRAEWGDISAFPVSILSDEQASELTSEMRLLHESAIALVHESKSLALVRDALLPRLVSGKIRVPDSYDPGEALGSVAEAVGAALP